MATGQESAPHASPHEHKGLGFSVAVSGAARDQAQRTQWDEERAAAGAVRAGGPSQTSLGSQVLGFRGSQAQFRRKSTNLGTSFKIPNSKSVGR